MLVMTVAMLASFAPSSQWSHLLDSCSIYIQPAGATDSSAPSPSSNKTSDSRTFAVMYSSQGQIENPSSPIYAEGGRCMYVVWTYFDINIILNASSTAK